MVGMIDLNDEGQLICWDDVSGKMLKTEKVIARQEEIAEFRKHNVYLKVPIEECYQVTGKEPLGIRWIDINSRGDEFEEYRSRLVAKEIKFDKREDLFAATPPLEAIQILFKALRAVSRALHLSCAAVSHPKVSCENLAGASGISNVHFRSNSLAGFEQETRV